MKVENTKEVFPNSRNYMTEQIKQKQNELLDCKKESLDTSLFIYHHISEHHLYYLFTVTKHFTFLKVIGVTPWARTYVRS